LFENAIRLGSIAGIRIGVHYTWFIIFLLLSSTLYASFRINQPDWPQTTALVTAVITALLFFSSIVLHELGHSIVAIRHGIRVSSITLFIFGGVAQSEKDAESAQTEFLVAIAGPAVSVTLAAFFYFLSQSLGPAYDVAAVALDWLATINLLVAIFNMIPGFPLDGGRVFRAIVWGLTGDATKGMDWAVTAGKLFAYLLMGLGFMIAIQTRLFINGIWLFGIGWFLLISAQASGQAFTVNRIFKKTSAGELMETDIPTVPATLMLSSWLEDYVLKQGRRAFLVVEAGTIVGLMTLADCNKISRSQWQNTPLSAAMTPVERLQTVDVSTDIMQVMQLMASRSFNQVPVTDAGKVVGWVDRDRLIKILQLHQEAGA
jgi:Zn-dependent protease